MSVLDAMFYLDKSDVSNEAEPTIRAGVLKALNILYFFYQF